MKNNKLSQKVIASIQSCKGFEAFDGSNFDFLSKDPERLYNKKCVIKLTIKTALGLPIL